jgi:hypothetical protein
MNVTEDLRLAGGLRHLKAWWDDLERRDAATTFGSPEEAEAPRRRGQRPGFRDENSHAGSPV